MEQPFVNVALKMTMLWRYGACLLLLSVLGCASEEATDIEVFADMGVVDADLTQIGRLTPEYCGSCHPSHFEQWRMSMHAFATKDPIFQAMNKKGIEETGGRLNQFCVQCHAPNASLRDELPVVEENGRHTMALDMNDPVVSEGVQCTTCHRIEAVVSTQNASISLSDTTFYGAGTSAAAQEAHPMEASPLFADPAQKSILCGSCHDVLNPNGVRLDSTFSAWYANGYNRPGTPEHRTCQDCHMPTYQGRITTDGPMKTLHSHTFVGVYQALVPNFPGKPEQAEIAQRLLQDCAEVDIRYNGVNEDGDAILVVSVKNINNGHNLPSGSTADTQVWVHLQVFDDNDQLVYESGMTDENGDLMDGVVGHSVDPDGDPELMLYGQFVLDDENRHVTFAWEAHQFTDNLIPPGQRKWRDFEVPSSLFETDGMRVLATLNYRTFPPFFLRTLIQDGFLDADAIGPVPIIEMERVEAEFEL